MDDLEQAQDFFRKYGRIPDMSRKKALKLSKQLQLDEAELATAGSEEELKKRWGRDPKKIAKSILQAKSPSEVMNPYDTVEETPNV
jgi:hypothetical protein